MVGVDDDRPAPDGDAAWPGAPTKPAFAVWVWTMAGRLPADDPRELPEVTRDPARGSSSGARRSSRSGVDRGRQLLLARADAPA